MKQATMKVGGHDFPVHSPSVREYLAIESNKIMLSKGDYGGMCSARTLSSILALDLIDMVSVLSVLCPDLEKHPEKGLKTNSILELDMADVKPIIEAYNIGVKPFVDGWMKEFRNLLPNPKNDAQSPAPDDGGSK